MKKKYKIISEDLMNNIIDFLDEIDISDEIDEYFHRISSTGRAGYESIS